MGYEASGGGYDDVGALGESSALLFVALAVIAAIHGHAVDVHIVGKALEGLVNLAGEFAGGGHDEAVDGVGGVWLLLEEGEYGQKIGRCLAGAGLCDAYDVASLKEMRDALLLHGRALFEVHVPDGVEDVVGKGKVVERGHKGNQA